MPIYPEKAAEQALSPKRIGVAKGENTFGRSVNFNCGSVVRFSLSVDDADRRITDVRFTSNGCGYMVAAAETVAADLLGRELQDLHGLEERGFCSLVEERVGAIRPDRRSCADTVREAILNAFADYRKSRIEEFAGEKALICTCFGVSEETIVRFIEVESPDDLDEVMNVCRAGSGCGSCRMLIQELIDEARMSDVIE